MGDNIMMGWGKEDKTGGKKEGMQQTQSKYDYSLLKGTKGLFGKKE